MITTLLIKHIYINIEELIKDLYAAAEPFTICQIFDRIDKTENTTDDFVSWWTEYIDFLCHLPYPEGYFKRLVHTLKVYYKATGNNEQTLRQVDEFEADYQLKNAVRWYTRPSFLFSIINQAFRQQNTELLFLFGIFVQDIYKVLADEFKQNRILAEEYGTSDLTVYRSQIMSQKEIDRIKSPYTKYLTNTSLLSTSYRKSVADLYSDPNDSRQVLFEIDYNPCLLSRPYAPVAHLSYIPADEEVLFMPGTQFERLAVLHEKFWTVIRLKLRYNLSVEFQYENESRNLKNYVRRLGQHLFYKTPKNDRDIIFTKLNDLFPNEHLWLSAVKLDAIGCYQEWVLNDYTLAVRSYKKAIDLWKEFSETDIDAINAVAMLYNQLGYCCQKFAEESYDQSKTYSEAVLVNTTAANCDRVDSLNRLTEMYETKSKTDDSDKLNENASLAIKYQEQALNNMSTDSNYNDYDIVPCVERLGRLCELAHDYDKAIRAYEGAIRIYSQQIERDLPMLISLHQRIATIYLKDLKNYSLAIEYQIKTHKYSLEKYELKMTIEKRAEIQYNTRKIVNSYVQLADIYLEMKDNILARKNLNAALALYGEAEPELQDDRTIIESIYKKLKNMCFCSHTVL
ncbi:unnamed protein product [Didymodactylos carnosus]|uniref:Tetratricopeptide repeat protein n=1 Tax=Didymodactylos carnosus TaxID=1234261 RepID=A0A815DFE9_9BILA|nr:unnamed protein product [Didymodactylos carnosus]CAF4109704.1 unnamed protein product [Didymodactylos carnosus]